MIFEIRKKLGLVNKIWIMKMTDLTPGWYIYSVSLHLLRVVYFLKYEHFKRFVCINDKINAYMRNIGKRRLCTLCRYTLAEKQIRQHIVFQPPRRCSGRSYASHAGDRAFDRDKRTCKSIKQEVTATLSNARQQVWVSLVITIMKGWPVSQ